MSSQSQPSDDFRGQRILSHTNNGVYHRFFITYIQYWFNTSPSAMVISTLLILFPFYFQSFILPFKSFTPLFQSCWIATLQDGSYDVEEGKIGGDNGIELQSALNARERRASENDEVKNAHEGVNCQVVQSLQPFSYPYLANSLEDCQKTPNLCCLSLLLKSLHCFRSLLTIPHVTIPCLTLPCFCLPCLTVLPVPYDLYREDLQTSCIQTA